MISRTVSTSRRRSSIAASVSWWRSSTSWRVTPGICAAPGSTSRGTATSTMRRGTPPRRSITASTSARSTWTSVESVAVRSTSTLVSTSCKSPSGTARPPRRSARSTARAWVRFATTTSPTPAAMSARPSPSATSPAPRINTERPRSENIVRSASATAAEDTDNARRPIAVSVRTRLPSSIACRKTRAIAWPDAPSDSASCQASRTWPRISPSPTIIESRPAATPKR